MTQEEIRQQYQHICWAEVEFDKWLQKEITKLQESCSHPTIAISGQDSDDLYSDDSIECQDCGKLLLDPFTQHG